MWPPHIATPLVFFSHFAKFQYRPSLSPFAEFNCLCDKYGWEKDGMKRKNVRSGFNITIKKEFNNLYESNKKNIKNWCRLCHILKIDLVLVAL
jgi:hypothetical protein